MISLRNQFHLIYPSLTTKKFQIVSKSIQIETETMFFKPRRKESIKTCFTTHLYILTIFNHKYCQTPLPALNPVWNPSHTILYNKVGILPVDLGTGLVANKATTYPHKLSAYIIHK